jgi:hypothetical protein
LASAKGDDQEQRLPMVILEQLDALLMRSPRAWAGSRQCVCAALLRTARSAAHPNSGLTNAGRCACLYQLAEFQQYEACQNADRLITARDIEQGLWRTDYDDRGAAEDASMIVRYRESRAPAGAL